MERLMRKDEVAETLSVSVRTIERLIERGELPAVVVGSRLRVRPESVERFVQEKGTAER